MKKYKVTKRLLSLLVVSIMLVSVFGIASVGLAETTDGIATVVDDAGTDGVAATDETDGSTDGGASSDENGSNTDNNTSESGLGDDGTGTGANNSNNDDTLNENPEQPPEDNNQTDGFAITALDEQTFECMDANGFSIEEKNNLGMHEVTIDAPNAINLQVTENGAPIADTTGYEFEWYQRFYDVSEGALKWVEFSTWRNEPISGNNLDIPASSSYFMGQMALYCFVSKNGTALNDLPDPQTNPMLTVNVASTETSVVASTDNQTVGIKQGATENIGGGTISVSADGKNIEINNVNLDSSVKNDNDWTGTALCIEIPEKEGYEDVNISFKGDNSLKCSYDSDGEYNNGRGLAVLAPGVHDISINGDSLSTDGGYQAILLSGDVASTASYHLSGLELTAKNIQKGMVKAPGALVLEYSNVVFKNMSVDLITDSLVALRCNYTEKQEGEYFVTIGKGTDMDITMQDRKNDLPPNAMAIVRGIINGYNPVTIDNAAVDIVYEAARKGEDLLLGIDASEVSIVNASVVSIDYTSPETQNGGLRGIQTTSLEVSNSDFSIKADIPDTIEAAADGIICSGDVVITDNSNVSVDIKAPKTAYGIYGYNNKSGNITGTLLVRDSNVSVNCQAGDDEGIHEAVGIKAAYVDISQKSTHTVKSQATGGHVNLAIAAQLGASQEEKAEYTPEYTATRWTLGDETVVLSPYLWETNLFGYKAWGVQGFSNNETIYSIGNSTTPASMVEIGYRKAPGPNPAPKQPNITNLSPGAIYRLGDKATPLTVTASVTDGGVLSYQWYKKTAGNSGEMIPGATSASYTPPTDETGVAYYFVVITNTHMGDINTNVSNDITVMVWKGSVSAAVHKEPGSPKVTIDEAAFVDAVLTIEDKILLAEETDAKIEINLNVRAVQPSADDISKVTGTLMPAQQIDMYLDIRVTKTTYINGHPVVAEIHNLPSGAARLTLEIPSQYRAAGRTYAMVRVHEGAAAILGDIDANSDTITFESDGFSTYALVHSMSAPHSPTSGGISPKTGDESNTGLYIALLMVAGVSIMGVITYRRRKYINN